jgi:hypothetical protein
LEFLRLASGRHTAPNPLPVYEFTQSKKCVNS